MMSSFPKLNFATQAELPSPSESQVLLPPSPDLPPEHHGKRQNKSVAGVVEQKSLWNTEIIR